MKQWMLIVCLVCGIGCAAKNYYYYHPEKTPAGIEMDYTDCMHAIDARLNRQNPVSNPLRECMESKGYRLISKKEAQKLGIDTSAVWPPNASSSSCVGHEANWLCQKAHSLKLVVGFLEGANGMEAMF